MQRQSTRNAQIGLMLAPYVLGLGLFFFVPALLSLGLAWTDYDALTPPRLVGLGNLRTAARDALFWTTLGNSLGFVLPLVAARMVLAFGLALLLLRPTRLNRLLRPLILLPSVMPDVAYALAWLLAFNPAFGPINRLLVTLGAPSVAWLVTPGPARAALLLLSLWQLAEMFVIVLASLAEIPRDLPDAAAVDGAGARAQLRHITLPLLLPRLLLLAGRDLALALHLAFVPVLLLTRTGVGSATLIAPLYGYLLAFDDLRIGYALAVVWLIYGALGALMWGVYRLLRARLYREGFAL